MPSSAARLEDRVLTGMSPWLRRGYPGLELAVLEHGKPILAMSLGDVRDRGTDVNCQSTIYRIYSMTKAVVSVALLILMDEGRFAMDDPLGKYLPEFREMRVEVNGRSEWARRPILVRDLLTMTAGFTYDFADENDVAALYRGARLSADPSRPLSDVVRTLSRFPLASHPGERWHYSVGMDVAAHLLEVLSNDSLGNVLQTRLFAPLGMVDTGFGVSADDRHRLAVMRGAGDPFAVDMTVSQLTELQDHANVLDVSSTYPSDMPDVFQRGGHGLFSTMSDYMAFAEFMRVGGRGGLGPQLSAHARRHIYTNQLTAALLPFRLGRTTYPGWGYGMAGRVCMEPGQADVRAWRGEVGWFGVGGTSYWIAPRQGLVGILFSQRMMAPPDLDGDFRAVVFKSLGYKLPEHSDIQSEQEIA